MYCTCLQLVFGHPQPRGLLVSLSRLFCSWRLAALAYCLCTIVRHMQTGAFSLFIGIGAIHALVLVVVLVLVLLLVVVLVLLLLVHLLLFSFLN